MLSILLVASVLAVGFWIRWRLKNRRFFDLAKKIPGPAEVPIFGNALTFMVPPEDLVWVLKKIIDEYGELFRFWLGYELNVVVSKPDDLKTLLTSGKTSVKGPQYKYMAEILGGGILSGSGKTWRRHRKITTPNYTKRAVEGYTDIFNTEADYLIKSLRKTAGRPIDIYKDIVKTTTYAVCQTIMGLSRKETLNLPQLQKIIDDSPRIYDMLFQRMTIWYLQIEPYFWITEWYQVQKNFIKNINILCTAIIECRKESLSKTDINLLKTPELESENSRLSTVDRFLLSQELNSEQLIQETFTLFTASQEASAKITSFFVLMLAIHPECQEKLYNEIKMVIDDRQVIDDDFKHMPYLEMVYKEVVRLFPIGAMIQRTVIEDIEISSCVIPAGSSLVVPIYHIHRSRHFWKNPDDFDPERFTPENVKTRHPYCYLPFSIGPMDCLGRHFATKLIKSIIVRILQEFKLSSQMEYKQLRLAIRISVASIDGYPVILSPRNK